MNILSKLYNLIKLVLISKSSMNGLSIRSYINFNTIDKSPKKQEDLLFTMKKGISILDSLGIVYSLGRGTLLGIHRDKKYTDGDNDIDIDVFEDKNIHEIINKLPFEIVLITMSAGRYQQLVMVDPETGVLFDIWFYSLIKNEYVNRHAQGFFKIPKNEVLNLKTILFEKKQYSCFDPNWYCEYWYGKFWKTPVKYSKTWIQFYKEDCSGFEFSPEKNLIFIKLF